MRKKNNQKVTKVKYTLSIGKQKIRMKTDFKLKTMKAKMTVNQEKVKLTENSVLSKYIFQKKKKKVNKDLVEYTDIERIYHQQINTI